MGELCRLVVAFGNIVKRDVFATIEWENHVLLALCVCPNESSCRCDPETCRDGLVMIHEKKNIH